jgi:hypothetical protein
MCFDISDGGCTLRQNASVWLAPWHNYKHAVALVWERYANMLFAPLFHHLYPHNKFIIKYPSPQEPTMIMLLVAKSYPSFRTQLVSALARMKAAKKTGYMKYSRLLQDILTLCEFLIPVVRVVSIFLFLLVLFTEERFFINEINKK